MLVHAGEAAEHALDRVLHLHRRLRVRGQGTKREPAGDRLQSDVQIGDRGHERADVAQGETRHVAAHDLRALGVVERAGDQAIALDEVVAEPKELYLFGE